MTNLPQLALIEYPANVVNIDKAIKTLTYTKQNEKESISLNFDPEDHFSTPIDGIIMEGKNKVLLKVRVTRSKTANDDDGERRGLIKSMEIVEPVGIVTKVIRFRRMASFAYDVQIPPDWSSLIQGVSQLQPDAVNQMSAKIGSSPGGIEEFYVFPPPISTHFDFPLAILGPEVFISSNRQSKLKKSASEIRNKLPWLVSFLDPDPPTSPTSEALSRMSSLHPDTIESIKAMFQERPIVSRLYAAQAVRIGYWELAKILPMFSYCFVDGPWRNCWVRYGVDPRSSPDYRFYQLVQCRNNLVSEGLTEADPGLHPPHIFTGDSSGGHFSQYQYCDLLYGPLKAIIDNPKGLQAACQKRDGWYPNRTTANIRQIIRKRWLEVLQAANPSAYSRVLELRKARSQQAEEGEDAEEEEDAEEDEAEEFDYYDEE